MYRSLQYKRRIDVNEGASDGDRYLKKCNRFARTEVTCNNIFQNIYDFEKTESQEKT